VEPALEVRNLTKRYGETTAVDELSFEVEKGEVFGLLGPNGSGKTTTIRIIMDIFQADSGEVLVLGEPPGRGRARIGYMPEERGLYDNLKVTEVLVYLARLKGLDASPARRRVGELLERFDLADRAADKVNSLSGGLRQKLQFIVCLVHDPDLLILDEPFNALDPINVALFGEIIRELQAAGKTVVLSSHQLNLVEALCDRIVLINHGEAVLYGPLTEIKRRHSPEAVRLATPERLDGGLPGVERVEAGNGGYVLTMEEGTGPQEVLRSLVSRGVAVEAFEVVSLPLEEIFVSVVRGGGQ
jgi:ABC-2 type transport system ATP-binding protein